MSLKDADLQPEPLLTRGHKKKARTRQLLIESAIKILAQKSVGEFTLKELAQTAGVSHGTTYNYFKTKEEVVSATGIALASDLAVIIDRVSHDIENGAERVALGVRTFVLKARQSPDWAGTMSHIVKYAQGMESAIGAYVLKDMRQGVSDGFLDYKNEELALGLLVSGVIGVMVNIVEDRYREGDDILIAEMLLKALGLKPENLNLVIKPEHKERMGKALLESSN